MNDDNTRAAQDAFFLFLLILFIADVYNWWQARKVVRDATQAHQR